MSPYHLLMPVLHATSSGIAQPTLSISSVRQGMRIILAVTEEVRRLHACGIVHRALEPSSILYNQHSGRVQFLRLSEASLVSKQRASVDSSSLLEFKSLWLYASPELSGKANRAVDARTDLYSLGAIFFELLTGRPPFQAQDVVS
jgi:histidine kinase